MSYATTVTLLDTEGGGLVLPVSARVWMTWSVLGSGSGTGNQQSEEGRFDGSVRRDLSAPLDVSFPGNANFAYASRGVAFSVQDTNRVGNDTGWLFRSGELPGDLPADSVEIVTASRTLTDADLAGALPALPLTVDTGTGTVLTALTTAITTDGIAVTATGTTNAAGPTVGLTFSATLVVLPSPDVRQPQLEALSVALANPAVSFAAGSNVVSNISAAVLNMIRPVLVRELRPTMQARLESMINGAVVAQVGGITGGALPEGVILSVRSVTFRAPAGAAATIEIRGALGAFGGVLSKIVPAGSTGGSSRCFVATVVRGEDSPDVAVLRRFRDTVLSRHAAGRAFVAAYETIGPSLATVVAKSSTLRRAADLAVVRPGVWIARSRLPRNEFPGSSQR